MGIYKNFTIKEAEDIGKEFKAVCDWGGSYHLTVGKEYIIRIETRILPMSPICSFVDDKGKRTEAHLTRFTKISEVIE